MTRFLPLVLLLAAASAGAQTTPVTRGIFVGNQGQPASLTFLDRAAGTAQQLTAVPLSSFLQSTAILNGRLYVTGNGNRIDVVDPATRQRVAQITDPAFGTARYFVQAGPAKAYVTTQNYAAGATTADVVVLNLTTNTVAGRITVPAYAPETLASAGGRVYVSLAAFGGETRLAVIDPATDALLAPVDIGCVARFVLADDDGEVFAVCTSTDEIVVVDGATGAVTDRVAVGEPLGSAFGIGQDGAIGRADIFGTSVELLGGPTATGLFFFDTDAHTVFSRLPIADVAARPISAVGYDPQRQEFVLGRPDASGPFSANGTVTVHDLFGGLVATYPAGIFPSHVAVDAVGGTAGEAAPVAGALRLDAPVPNPTAGLAEVRFALAAPSDVTATVVDALGREVARLASGAFAASEHRLPADLRGLPAGVYVVRLASGSSVVTRRITVAR